MTPSVATAVRVDRVVLGLDAVGFHDAFATLAGALASEASVPLRTILGALHERERTLSTGWGGGLAVPHARVPGLDRPYLALARLTRPIEYGAPDGCPVDLLFVVLSPAEEPAEHVRLLGRLARRLRDAEVLRRLRAARDDAEARSALECE